VARFNPKQRAQEIVRCGKDPAYFINKYVWIQHPTKGALKFDTFEFQDECLEAFQEHRHNIVLKSRQLGLTTLVAAYSVWMAVFQRNKNILIIATKLAVAQNFIKKVKYAYRRLPTWLPIGQIVYNNKQSIEFDNGSSIKAIPTSDDAGRSEALSLCIVDEAAFVRNFDEIWTALYSTLSRGGNSIVLSTPNGVGNKYHELYTQAEAGDNMFNPIRLPWHVHPEQDDEWFERETANMSSKQIAQELMCDFTHSGDTYLNSDDLESLAWWVKSPIDKWGPDMGVWVWSYPFTESEYIVSADVARGDASDYSAAHVIDVKRCEIVAEYKGKLPPDKFAQLLAEMGKRYNNALVCPENNTYGYAVVMKLAEMGYKNLYFKNKKDQYEAMYTGNVDLHKIGFSTQGNTRNQILTKLEEVIRNKKVRFYSSRLIDELKTFVWKGQKAQAMKGKNDDLVMALAIGVWLLDTDVSYSNDATELRDAMLSAFAINKTPSIEEIKRAHRMGTLPSMEPNRVPESVMGKSEARKSPGSLTGEDSLKEFRWLL
jgi:hypothetical protein